MLDKKAAARVYYLKNCERIKAKYREYYHNNKDKRKAQNKAWIASNKAKFGSSYRRNRTLRAKYNITLEEWEVLFNSQSRCCAICKSPTTGVAGWHTDHCHKTGKIRGILCNNCNHGLGNFNDSVVLFYGAIKYLEAANAHRAS